MLPNEKNIIGLDFQGWPVRKLTLREIITKFGGRLNEETGMYEIDKHLAEAIPTVCTDDGMGYGANVYFVVDADYDEGDYRLWIDVADAYIDIYLKDEVQPGMTIVTPDGSKTYILDTYVPVIDQYKVHEFSHNGYDEKQPTAEFIDRDVIVKWVHNKK